MRKLTFLMMLTLVVTGLCAQQSLLVFMEASEKKPFYVKIGAKTSASTSTGQVYITELPDSNYEIQVGFPETDIPEHRFQVTLRKNDNNFQLKQGGSQGWTLIDLESNQTLQPLVQPAQASYAIGGVRKTDAFAIMMAGVVNDTSVLYTSVIPPAPSKEQVVKKTPAVPGVGSPAGNSQAGTSPPAAASTNAETGSDSGNRGETVGTEVPAKKPGVMDSTSEKRAEAVVVTSGTDTKPEGDSGTAKSAVLTGADIAKEQAVKDSLAKDQAAKDLALKDQAAKDLALKEQAAKDLLAKDQAAKDLALKEQVAKDQAAKDLALKDQAAKDQATKDQIAKDELARTEAARELVAKDQAAKDKAAKDQAATDQAAKDQAAKDKAAKDKAVKDQAAQDQAAKAGTIKETGAGVLTIRKLSENKSDKQLLLKYADAAGTGKADTIDIIIPVETPTIAAPRKDSVRVKYSPNERPLHDPVTPTASAGDTAKSKGSGTGDQKSTAPVATTGPVMINSDCVNFATEYDVDKLRVKMVNEVTADDRIAAARKVFRTKCFTSRQIRALTELFLNDEGKYKFLDAAYPFVSDSQEFRKLGEVLKEEYYVKRFNAMIRT